MSKVTVIDRIKALGFEATIKQRTQIGIAVREKWRKTYGDLPEKDLRTKTGGGGSHCFALYPSTFVPEIDDVVEAFKLQDDQQGQLF